MYPLYIELASQFNIYRKSGFHSYTVIHCMRKCNMYYSSTSNKGPLRGHNRNTCNLSTKDKLVGPTMCPLFRGSSVYFITCSILCSRFLFL